ncbi:hypothetical protein [Streptococcus sp. DD13]|uniref:hypothetical protein n=1 Tax=Streptococcus sp. DD13 TaxID=1777881 RepID=UPI000798B75D|nr:hypothetical protein [Streptococcus sp. DD13]KXT78859.1 hypothetical protein STRDD13_00391 [Streptococcus sp. DD13]
MVYPKKTVDRTYLPFDSARYFQDRGMAKWMGFFLSEHTTALSKEEKRVELTYKLSPEEVQLFGSQIYAQQIEAVFTYLDEEVVKTITGKIASFQSNTFLIQTVEGYVQIAFDQLVTIHAQKRSQEDLTS